MLDFEDIKDRRRQLIVESAQRMFPKTKIIIEEMEIEDNYYDETHTEDENYD